MTAVALALLAIAPTRIKYDGHCLTIDGKDTFIYSGAFHYFRCPKPLWRDRLQKMKDAGLNCVETYVAWNWHERSAPTSLTDFSKADMTDLKDFLKLVHDEFGMYSIIRPGPYICAEWSGGGYPRWLASKRPANQKGVWYRTNEASYLAWCKHWYDACCPTIAKEQITHKPAGQKGTILFQLENEYDYAGLPKDVMVGQLKALKADAKANGIDVPLFTCWTWPVRQRVDAGLSDVFDGSNMYDRHNIGSSRNTVSSLRKAQPNAPVMIPELQGGWFSQVGGKLSEDQEGLDPAQIQAITLESIAQGASITSYYMFFGGSHLDDYAARDLITSYDYASPIREWGGVGPRYDAVKGIGEFLQVHGKSLARSEKLNHTTKNDLKDVIVTAVRKGSDGTFYAFVFNQNETEGRKGHVSVDFGSGIMGTDVDLKPFDYQVLAMSTKGGINLDVWPKPVEPTHRPKLEPRGMRIGQTAVCTELANPNKWYPRKPGQDLADLGVETAPFTLWRAKTELNAAQLKKYKTLDLRLNTDDSVVAQVNGKIVFPETDNNRELTFDLDGLLKNGHNEITLLYEDRGLPNGGQGMETPGYLVSGALGTGIGLGRTLSSWVVQPVSSLEEAKSLTAEKVDTSKWLNCTPGDDNSKIISGKRASAVYRTTLTLSAADIKAHASRIKFSRIDDKGTVYVNGHEVASHNDWATALEIDAAKYLHEGENSIAAVISNTDGEGGITMPVQLLEGMVDRMTLEWSVAPELQGYSAGFWHPQSPLAFWSHSGLKSNNLPTKGSAAVKSPTDALAKWYRVDFNMPKRDTGMWFPWSAVVAASGNGFMWLNGKPIGRYWQAGPQRQFFLPETYLNFGGPNTLVICLRTTPKGARLDGLEIKPYPAQGEFRENQ